MGFLQQINNVSQTTTSFEKFSLEILRENFIKIDEQVFLDGNTYYVSIALKNMNILTG